MSIRVVEWIPYEQGEGREENCLSGMGGFFNMNTKGQHPTRRLLASGERRRDRLRLPRV